MHSLSYITYYGSGCDLSVKDLQKYDIVVTTYQTIVGENSGVAVKEVKETGCPS